MEAFSREPTPRAHGLFEAVFGRCAIRVGLQCHMLPASNILSIARARIIGKMILHNQTSNRDEVDPGRDQRALEPRVGFHRGDVKGVQMMGPPVRVVCRGCLRSVEIDRVGDSHPTGDCPYCGQPVDSRLAKSGPGEELDSILDSRETTLGESGRARDWTATWSRGSLGRLGRFQLRERLGDGGFGEVYLAYDPRLDRDVAIKVLRDANPSERAMERFFREARAAARLDHPNIVGVYDAGFDKGRCWVAYQYVSGRPLWRHRDYHRITPIAAARIFRDLARAVDYAHQRGVVHRDLKPANILIDDLGRPRLIDFGLARRPDLDSDLTRDGAVVGTPAYMSPEQALGLGRQVDERSDVFSLGVILYETLSGKRPSFASTWKADAGSTRHGREADHAPFGLSDADGAIPPGLDRILERATADLPSERYPTAGALADDLEAWLLDQEKAKPRRPSLIGASLVAAVVILAMLGAWRSLSPPSRSEPEPGPGPAAHSDAFAGSPSRAIATGASLEIRAAPLVPKGVPFVGNLKKKRYHLAECEDVKLMSPSNIHPLQDVDQAETRGLKPCENCRPSARDVSEKS